MTVQEAAARIGVTEAVIRHATLGGRLPFVRKSGRILIESSQLQAHRARIQQAGEKTASKIGGFDARPERVQEKQKKAE